MSESARNTSARLSTTAPASCPARASERRNAARQSAGWARVIARVAISFPFRPGAPIILPGGLAVKNRFLFFSSRQPVDRRPAGPAELFGALGRHPAERDHRGLCLGGQRHEA